MASNRGREPGPAIGARPGPQFAWGILVLIALVTTGWFTFRYLRAHTPRARLTRAVRQIGNLYNPTFTHPQPEKTNREARDELRAFGAEAVPLLIKFAQSDPDLELRLGAIDALSEFPETRGQIVPALVSRLSNCQSFMEAGRLTSTLLAISPADEPIPSGLKALLDSTDACPRIHAAWFILKREPRQNGARAVIVAALADVDISSRAVTAGQTHAALRAMSLLAELDPADRAFAEPQLQSLAELDPDFTRGFSFLDTLRQEAQRVVAK